MLCLQVTLWLKLFGFPNESGDYGGWGFFGLAFFFFFLHMWYWEWKFMVATWAKL